MATIHSIGHSTRTGEDFLALLHQHGVRTLVDVRRFPGSRRHPQFGREALEAMLRDAGIRYVHAPDLGGRRTADPDSRNRAWRNAAFRGYADYMATPAFAEALDALEEEATAAPTVMLCAEAVPWRCHRNLIADALVARGHEVRHILGGDKEPRAHTLPDHARIEADGLVVYPGAPDEQMGLL